jgi:hypothetical protein
MPPLLLLASVASLSLILMPPKKAKQASGSGASGGTAPPQGITSPPPMSNISRGATPTSDPNESPPMTSQGNSSLLGAFTSPPVSYLAAVLGSGMQPAGATAGVFSSNSMFNVPAPSIAQGTNSSGASKLVAQGTNVSGASILVPPALSMMSPTDLPTNATTPFVIGGVVFHKLPVRPSLGPLMLW